MTPHRLVPGTEADLAAGNPATGLPKLKELIDERVVLQACDWLGIASTKKGTTEEA